MRLHLPIVIFVFVAGCGRASVGASDGDATSEGETATTSTETPDTSDDGDAAEDGAPEDCGGFSIVPTFIPSNVMFVVDASSSMLESWDHDQDPKTAEVSRWHSVRSLLEQLIPEADDRFRLGLQRAPSANATDADVCLIEPTPEIEIGDFHGAQILVALPDVSGSELELVGGSPIGAAWLSARDQLLAHPSRTISAVVLITDGGANCAEPNLPEAVEVFDAGLETMITEGYAVHGIPTVVVGVDVDERQPSLPAQPDSPAVDTHAALNAIALAGGIPWDGGFEPRKYFDVREIDDLHALFDPLITETTTCTIDLMQLEGGPPEPAQIPLVTIEIESVEVPHVLDCENDDGWTWIEEGVILTFCGIHCEKVKMGSPIEGTYGCPLPN